MTTILNIERKHLVYCDLHTWDSNKFPLQQMDIPLQLETSLNRAISEAWKSSVMYNTTYLHT